MTDRKALKKAVRERMAATGESYTTAYRALTEHTSWPAEHPVSATVTWTRSTPSRAQPLYWEITVDDPRQPGPIQTVIYWSGRPAVVLLDDTLNRAGWWRVKGSTWPDPDTTSAGTRYDLVLERSDLGRRTDLLAAAGLTVHTAHEPYFAAVAYSLTRAGIAWEHCAADSFEPRGGSIALSEPLPGDEALFLAWRENRGWFYVPYSDAGQALGDDDLPVAPLAEPHEVAQAVRELVGGMDTRAEPMWHPPAGYDPAATGAEDSVDASAAFEAALATYTTHPAWTKQPRCEGCGNRAAHYVIGVATGDPAEHGAAIHTRMVCELCDSENVLSRRLLHPEDLLTEVCGCTQGAGTTQLPSLTVRHGGASDPTPALIDSLTSTARRMAGHRLAVHHDGGQLVLHIGPPTGEGRHASADAMVDALATHAEALNPGSWHIIKTSAQDQGIGMTDFEQHLIDLAQGDPGFLAAASEALGYELHEPRTPVVCPRCGRTVGEDEEDRMVPSAVCDDEVLICFDCECAEERIMVHGETAQPRQDWPLNHP